MSAIGRDSQTSVSFSFNSETEEKAAEILKKYPDGWETSAVMPLLDLAQRQNGGWLSQEAMDYVAERLSMPLIRVYEVATFYTMYNLKPIGRHHIEVCTNLPCWLRGSDKIVEACQDFLGINLEETTDDGMFSLSKAECLGACVNAPMMQIGDDYYEDLDEGSTVAIISELKVGGEPKSGTYANRYTCEPVNGLTSLVFQKNLLTKKLARGKQ